MVFHPWVPCDLGTNIKVSQNYWMKRAAEENNGSRGLAVNKNDFGRVYPTSLWFLPNKNAKLTTMIAGAGGSCIDFAFDYWCQM